MSNSITDECIGCAACAAICPTGAISGEKKEAHAIDGDLCIECDACGRVCPKSCVLDSMGRGIQKLKKKLWPRPVIDQALCYACENCVDACPVNALAMAGEQLPLDENYAVLAQPETCISCGWCVSNCLFDAVCMEEKS